MDYVKMFNGMHPGFFDDPGIKGMPKNWVFSELIMNLRTDSPLEVVPPCPENITFGEYKGDIDELKKVVNEVDEDWVQYFSKRSKVFCAFDQDEVVAFCVLCDLGTHDDLKVGGPGCVGTIPKYRKMGIGLEMVRRATDILKNEKYDISWIHFTHIENWYKKLGYKTVLKWNSDGMRLIEDITYSDSMGHELIALNNGSYIVVDNGIETLYGEAYRILNGELKKICEDEKCNILGDKCDD